ncbi:glycosyltransferase family 20-domain-containing protein [Entophlyctis helioformis]|nr:glycosyltransferase family 20-domain-containing protein [Entophlyctis helioformis]
MSASVAPGTESRYSTGSTGSTGDSSSSTGSSASAQHPQHPQASPSTAPSASASLHPLPPAAAPHTETPATSTAPPTPTPASMGNSASIECIPARPKGHPGPASAASGPGAYTKQQPPMAAVPPLSAAALAVAPGAAAMSAPAPAPARLPRPDRPKPPGRILVVSHHLPWVCNRSVGVGAAASHASFAARNSDRTGPLSASSEPPAESILPLGGLSGAASPSTTGSPSTAASPSAAANHNASQWTLTQRRGHSALFSGIRLLTDSDDYEEDVVHIGWLGYGSSDPNAVVLTPSTPKATVDDVKELLWSRKQCVPVVLDEEAAKNHYEGYCKTELWPLFHYILWDNAMDGKIETRYYNDYVKVNQTFADAVCAIYRPGDTIWVQDYHLLMVPSMLRKALPGASIGFFLHTPFPSSEIFRALPHRTEILTGLLGANLIGFQTYSHARHFISSCTRVLGCESSPTGVEFHGFTVNIGIFPIGIDVERVESRRRLEAVQQKIKSIRELFPGKRIIIGRDKLDHIKGVQHKLNSFEKFLQLFPEWQNKVALVQVTSPPQRPSPQFASKISESVSRINGTYGSLEFVPVHHYHQNLDQEEYYALLSMADIALITSIRDGMNTSSHEFVVCQQENAGSLILSEFTGTAGSMSGAYLVNPWDYVGVAHAINDALLLSKEDRVIKHKQLYAHVTSHTAQFWSTSFIKELRKTALVPDHQTTTPILDISRIIDGYQNSKKRLLLFDYDGTLTPIRKVPSAAVPPVDMLKAMNALVRDPRNVVFVISGRDQACLDDWLGHIPNLGLSAEHGSFIKYPGGKWINLAERIDLSWKPKVSEIFNFFTERTQGSFVEQKRYAITWHYRLADPEYGTFQAKECLNHLENAIVSKLPVEILIGKKNLEVRPTSMNKGEIVKRLVQLRQPECDFVFCVGDDRTDEDMFKVLRKSELAEAVYFTTTIGSATKKTHAQWHVSSPQDVIDLIGDFAEISVGGSRPSTTAAAMLERRDSAAAAAAARAVLMAAKASSGSIAEGGNPNAAQSGSRSRHLSADDDDDDIVVGHDEDDFAELEAALQQRAGLPRAGPTAAALDASQSGTVSSFSSSTGVLDANGDVVPASEQLRQADA